MALWIRSQDKKHLMKCEALMYEQTGVGFGIRVFTKNYDFNIANYETKERALEVLDEIQDFIEKQCMKHISSSGMFYKKYVVYTMPQE